MSWNPENKAKISSNKLFEFNPIQLTTSQPISVGTEKKKRKVTYEQRKKRKMRRRRRGQRRRQQQQSQAFSSSQPDSETSQQSAQTHTLNWIERKTFKMACRERQRRNQNKRSQKRIRIAQRRPVRHWWPLRVSCRRECE